MTTIDALAGDSRSMMGTVVSSNVLKELLANAGEVIWLDEFQADRRVRAYALEARADEKMSERTQDVLRMLKSQPQV